MLAGRYPRRDEMVQWLAGAASIFSAQVAELVAIGAAIGSNCEPCLKYHVAQARKLGVDAADMRRAVDLAQKVKDAPARAMQELAQRLLEPAAAVSALDAATVGARPADGRGRCGRRHQGSSGQVLLSAPSSDHANMKFLDQPPRFLFFTGNGGVGKTSIACASAIRLAEARQRVLLVSTDPASNLGQVFGVTIGNRITAIPAVARLAARDNRPPRFQRVRAPDKSELEDLVHLISQRADRCLERLGLLEQDAESA